MLILRGIPMTIKSRPVLFWAAAAVIGLLAIPSAEAGSIKITVGPSSMIITDDDFTDMSPVEGVVAFMGTLGGWTFTLTSGTTKPEVGSATSPIMELRDVTLTSGPAGGKVTIWFSEVGFGPTGSLAESSLTGATGGTVKFQTFKGGTELFDTSTALSTISVGSGAFSASDSKTISGVGGPYSLTEKVTITHSGGIVATALKATLTVGSGATSAVPDGGMTLSLLGIALIGLAGLRRLQRH